MEQIDTINQELAQKSIERPKGVDFATGEEVIEGGVVNKPKKPRSQAQKDAFEKARKKRAENLKKKKEAEEGVSQEVKTEDSEVVEKSNTATPPEPTGVKKRGRPKGVKNKKVMKRDPEPEPPQPLPHTPAPVYLDYPPPHNPRYPQQGLYYPPPPQYYHPPPQPQPQPVNNYYYYGSGQTPAPSPDPQVHPPQKEEDYEVVEDSLSSEEEPDNIDYHHGVMPQTPQLKYRFA